MLVEKRKKLSAEIPTSSMADIAFLLLIFFIVITTITSDKGLDLTLPPPGEVKPIPPKNISNLLLNASGQVLLDEEPIEINLIRDVLKDKIIANKKLIVSIKNARETDYNFFISVLDQVKQAYSNLRDDYALSQFNKEFNRLNSEQKDQVKEEFPVRISIAEPEKE